MISGCDSYLSHTATVLNVDDVSYLTEMDKATDLHGPHSRVKSGGNPYTYSVWPSSFHGLWEAGWAGGFIRKLSRQGPVDSFYQSVENSETCLLFIGLFQKGGYTYFLLIDFNKLMHMFICTMEIRFFNWRNTSFGNWFLEKCETMGKILVISSSY